MGGPAGRAGHGPWDGRRRVAGGADLGVQMLSLEPVHAFAAETTAGLIIVGAPEAGVPVSTTYTITTAIMGVGAARRLSAVRWGVTREIALTWLCTFPGPGVVAALASLLLSR